METSEILILIFGSGGIGFLIVKHFLDKSVKREQSEQDGIQELKSKLKSLHEKIEDLTEEKLQLSIKLAKLEERVLLHAKNRAKHKMEDMD